jgi:hypothetical protein
MINGKDKNTLLLHELTGKYSKQVLDYLHGTRQLKGGHGMSPVALKFLNERLDMELAYERNERNERLRLAAAI